MWPIGLLFSKIQFPEAFISVKVEFIKEFEKSYLLTEIWIWLNYVKLCLIRCVTDHEYQWVFVKSLCVVHIMRFSITITLLYHLVIIFGTIDTTFCTIYYMLISNRLGVSFILFIMQDMICYFLIKAKVILSVTWTIIKHFIYSSRKYY